MYNIVYYIYYYYTIYINSIIYYTILYRYCGVDDGGFKQPHLCPVLRTSISGLARYVAPKAWVSCDTKVDLF